MWSDGLVVQGTAWKGVRGEWTLRGREKRYAGAETIDH